MRILGYTILVMSLAWSLVGIVRGQDMTMSPATTPTTSPCHMTATTPAVSSTGDKRLCAGAAQKMSEGESAFSAGKMDLAAADWRDAMNQYRDAGCRAEFCDASQNLAAAYQSLGQANLATQTLQTVLAEARRMDDRHRVMSLLASLGAASIATIEATNAEPSLTEAMSMAKDLGDAACAGFDSE